MAKAFSVASWNVEHFRSQRVDAGLTAFFTQKIGFRSGVSLLRPGALLTVKVGARTTFDRPLEPRLRDRP